VYNLEDQIADEEQLLQEETETRRNNGFRDRLLVGKLVKETLNQNRRRIEEKSYHDVRHENRNFLRARKRMQNKLLASSVQAEEASRLQQRKYGQVMRLRIYRDVLGDTATMQEKRVDVLERKRRRASKQIENKRGDLSKACERLVKAKELQVQEVSLTKQLEAVEGECKDTEASGHCYKEITMKKIQSMIHEARTRMYDEKWRQSEGYGNLGGWTATRAQALLGQIRYDHLRHRRVQSAPTEINRLVADLDNIASQQNRSPLRARSAAGTRQRGQQSSSLHRSASLDTKFERDDFVVNVKDESVLPLKSEQVLSDDDAMRIWHSSYSEPPVLY